MNGQKHPAVALQIFLKAFTEKQNMLQLPRGNQLHVNEWDLIKAALAKMYRWPNSFVNMLYDMNFIKC